MWRRLRRTVRCMGSGWLVVGSNWVVCVWRRVLGELDGGMLAAWVGGAGDLGA